MRKSGDKLTPSITMLEFKEMEANLAFARARLVEHLGYLDHLGDSYAVKTIIQAPFLNNTVNALDAALSELNYHCAALEKIYR